MRLKRKGIEAALYACAFSEANRIGCGFVGGMVGTGVKTTEKVAKNLYFCNFSCCLQSGIRGGNDYVFGEKSFILGIFSILLLNGAEFA